jgi:predicted nucleic acid-binding protein
VRFLLDTNVLSDVRKARPNASLTAWFEAQDPDDLFVSVLTLGEIREGIERLRTRDAARAQALALWLGDLAGVYEDRVLPVDHLVADEWGRLRAIRSLPVVDALLAATARVHGLTLVTRNDRDFRGLGLTVLNPARLTNP